MLVRENLVGSYGLCFVAPDEVIIADDGSGQETRELIERFTSSLPRFATRQSPYTLIINDHTSTRQLLN